MIANVGKMIVFFKFVNVITMTTKNHHCFSFINNVKFTLIEGPFWSFLKT